MSSRQLLPRRAAPAAAVPEGAVGPAARGRRRQSPRARRRRWLGLAFAAPALIMYGFVVVVPIVQSVSYSFYSWDGVSTARFVGLSNYTAFFTDPELGEALAHVLVLVLFFAGLPILLGLLSAALLGRGKLRGAGLYRWLLFLPQVLTSVVVAVIWKRIYGPNGPLNSALRAVGLGDLARNWLGDFTWALPSLGVIGTWTALGLCMVLFVAGVAAIPNELYEQARLDGASPVKEFLAITLPALRGQLAVALTLTVTGALRAFDLVWVTTQGGPGTSTTTPALLLYRKAFLNPDVGMAAAIGIVLAIICLLVALIITRLSEENA
ncbi:carbohydrate ABC transporter permease [Kribbella jejuensis]|uniref:Carbohydrate ABC transporter membrane protein 1 (CUT1 family) n=1 Tax=Kribbella jejuensis TaxID=236068 RepID=A0A542ELH8_9ACTN|nr:sugar ABC transporter permease [Kribbella jejuensis]TQJ16188.1 carbohydrate ABC transporter membrane protein 1 (CUT1 family) [Kribbella jejuensis]